MTLFSPTVERWLRRFFFLGGLFLFLYLIYRLKPEVIASYLRTVGWRFGFILLIALSWYLLYVVAWEIFLKSLKRRIHFFEIFKIKMAGEAINNLTPLSWGGGDPARIWMLKTHIPIVEGTASVVVDRTLNNLAVALFMMLGILLALIRLRLPPILEVALPFVFALLLLGSGFLYLRSHEGLFQFFLDLLKKLRLKKKFSEKTLKHVAEIDGHISHFYKMNRKGFVIAFLLHFSCRWMGVLEIFYAAKFLEHPLGLLDSYLLASLTVAVNIVFVFIPGSLGVLEGAFAGIFALLHLDPAVGTSVQIIRRARMLFYTGLGFLFITQLKKQDSEKDLHAVPQNEEYV